MPFLFFLYLNYEQTINCLTIINRDTIFFSAEEDKNERY